MEHVYPFCLWFPPAPVKPASMPVLTYGRILFAWLAGLHVDGRPAYGMLTAEQLELALRASQDLLAPDAAPKAIDAFAVVRRRIVSALQAIETRDDVSATAFDEPLPPARLPGGHGIPIPGPKPRPLAPIDLQF